MREKSEKGKIEIEKQIPAICKRACTKHSCVEYFYTPYFCVTLVVNLN